MKSAFLLRMGALLTLAACSRRAPESMVAREEAAPSGTHPIARPADALASFAVLTEASGEAATRATAGDAGASVEVRRVAEWGTPPKDALLGMAEGLTEEERASIAKRETVVVVSDRGPADARALVARAAWSAAARIATDLRGLVYDETIHRLENASSFAAHASPWPPDANAWRADRVRVESYDTPGGTARIVTRGLRRFGLPDLAIEGAPAKDARALGVLLGRLGETLASGVTTAPIALGPGDFPAVDLVPASPHEADPDNVVLRVVPLFVGPDAGAAYDVLAARALDPNP